MKDNLQIELLALGNRWRNRATTFMSEAERSARPADIIRLTAMASTLEWAANDLSVYQCREGSTTTC
jgi:hypothetical protein